MIPVIVVCVYLVIIGVIGGLAFRKSQANTEDYFLANRSVGEMVFFLSLFATNMTAFAILGSSGQAYRQGIGIYGLMASSSGLVIPLTIFFIGTRLWALGKRFGHQTQVAFFRDRWECDTIGTVIFALSALMLVPYMIISIMGGGTVLAHLSDVGGTRSPIIPYPVGCAVVAMVVTLGVFLGGMRGTVWVNILQTTLFLCFGAVAVVTISHALPGGFGEYISKLAGDPKTSFLVTRERMPPQAFWSYTEAGERACGDHDGGVGLERDRSGDGRAQHHLGRRVVEPDAHPEGARLRVGLRRDLAHAARGADRRIGDQRHIDEDAVGGRLDEPGRDVEHGVAAIAAGDGHDHLPGLNDLAGFGAAHGDDARRIGAQFGEAKPVAGRFELRLGVLERSLRRVQRAAAPRRSAGGW